jgi:probable HAF family extracellular repeat protein
MKSSTMRCITMITVFATLVVSALLAQEQQHGNEIRQNYSVKGLGTLGGTFAIGQGVNNNGWVVGFANLDGDQNYHAFLWVSGIKTDLGTFGGPNSAAFQVNSRGQVVGNAESSISDPTGEDPCGNGTKLICSPFLWEHGGMHTLPTLGGLNGSADSINNRGHIVGWAENTLPDTTCPVDVTFAQSKPVLWSEDGIKELPIIDGDSYGSATAINNEGQVVGSSGDCTSGPRHALLWTNGTVTDLGNLGGLFNTATAINNHGQVVGLSNLPGDKFVLRGFVWQNGVMINLGVFPGDVHSLALGINDKGQIVGDSCDESFSCRAFLWQNGTMLDLNRLVHSPDAPFLENGNSINSRGQIAGKTTVQGTPIAEAFLATPCGHEGAHNIQSCEGASEGTASKALGSSVAARRPAGTPPDRFTPEMVAALRARLGHRYHIRGFGAPSD